MKKFMAFFLIIILGLSLFIGCNNTAKNTSVVTDSEEEAEKKQEISTENNEEEIPEIVVYHVVRDYQKTDPEVRKMVQDEIIKGCGIKVTVIPAPEGEENSQKLNLLLASGEKLDAFQAKWIEYAKRDAIMPLDDLLKEYGQDCYKQWQEYGEQYWKSVSANGKIWAIPSGADMVVYPISYRTDWLKKLGLSEPKTIDELKQVLIAIKENDPAGGGKTIPMATDWSGLTNCLLGAYTENGNSNWLDTTDNKVKPVVLEPGYKDFIQEMRNWYEDGLIYSEAFITDRARYTELFKQGLIGTTAYWYSLITLNIADLQKVVPEADYTHISVTGPKGIGETMVPATVRNQTGIVINKKSENPEAVMKFINWNYEDIANYITTCGGIQGKHWEFASKDIVDREGAWVPTWPDNEPKYYFDYRFCLNSLLGTKGRQYIPDNPAHYLYLVDECYTNTGRAKRPFDADVVWDQPAILEAVPELTDLNRMIQEESIKFIIGSRPMSEFDDFINELDKVGMQKYIEELTAQYNNSLN